MTKTCIICGREKHSSRFGFLEDNTCNICRKLMKENIIISPRADISQATFFRGITPVTCVTCGRARQWDEFPSNSHECMYCTNARHNIEAAKLSNLDCSVKCSVCSRVRSVVHFPFGEFICKTCINKTNKYKGGVLRYAK